MANIAIAPDVEPRREEFTLTAPDGCTFPALRYRPAAHIPVRAALVLLHGFIEHHLRYDHVLRFFASQGIDALAFSQRGFGPRSKGEYGDTSWKEQYEDVEEVLVEVRRKLDEQYEGRLPMYLYGHSMGGGLAFGFFTRPSSSAVPSASTKALISGVICSSPWLRLAHPPPGVAFWLAPRLLRLFPKMPWYAPVNPAELSHDQAVIDDNKSDPLISPRVYLRAVVGPLLGGLKLLSDEYKNWPADLPILFTHGEDDPVTDCKASREMESKIEARDKECKTWKGAYHEVHNEEGEMKVEFLQYTVDWILKRAPGEGIFAKGEASSSKDASQLQAPPSQGGDDTNASNTTDSAFSTLPTTMASSSALPRGAWATLMTGEKYLPGLAVFAHSLLREHKSAYPLVVMTTGKLSEEARQCVLALGCEIREVKDLRPEVAGTNMAYARFGDVWTKLRAFELAEYERVIMVDSDMLVRRNMDELMTLPLDDGMQIAAGFACTCNPAKMASYPKDWIPENCAFTPQSHPTALTQPLKLDASSKPTHKLLNSGLVVLTPSSETMRAMEQRLNSDPSVKEMAFPDQDFLAAFYAGAWQPLPWVYNALKKLRAAHADMWRDDKVANVHYIIDKPWESLPSDEHPDAVTHGWWWAAWRHLDATHGNIDAPLWQLVNKYVVQEQQAQ